VWKTDDDDSACAGELLYNNICLPKQWPPLWDAAGGPPPRSGPAIGPPRRPPIGRHGGCGQPAAACAVGRRTCIGRPSRVVYQRTVK
jgi:hypothetical protein